MLPRSSIDNRDLRSAKSYLKLLRDNANCSATSGDGARKSRSVSYNFPFDMMPHTGRHLEAGRSALRWVEYVCLSLMPLALYATGTWESALDQMPLGAGITELSRTNCVDLMLKAFQSNAVVKALIFMPGATDEFYMFKRARAQLTNASPTLLDAERVDKSNLHSSHVPSAVLAA